MWHLTAFTILLTGLLLMQAPAHAQSVLRLKLSATVAPTCRIIEQSSNPVPEGVRVRLEINCNVVRYRLSFAEAGGPAKALDTSGVEADFDPQQNAIMVETITPGPQEISFTMRDAGGIAALKLITMED